MRHHSFAAPASWAAPADPGRPSELPVTRPVPLRQPGDQHSGHVPGVVADALWSYLHTGGTPLLVIAAGTNERPPHCVWATGSCAEVFHREPADLIGSPVDALLWGVDGEPDDGTALAELMRPTRTVTGPLGARHADGSWHRVVVTAHPLLTPRDYDTPVWVLSLTGDLGATQELLAASEHRFVALAERSPIPTMLSEVGIRLAHVNDAFVELIGASAETLLGVGWMEHVHPADRDRVVALIQETMLGENTQAHIRLVTSRQDERRVELRLAPVTTRGRAAGFVGTIEDITERLALQEELYQQARQDPLTGLMNRTQLWDFLLGAMDQPGLVVFFLDLDNFKVINDSLGHDAGDALLIQIAARLRTATRAPDAVARFGGDEFVVACPLVGLGIGAVSMAERLLTAVTTPVTLGSVQIRPSASIGVVVRGPEHASPQDLLRDADIAMYQAKNGGKNRYALCDSEAREAALRELTLVSDLHAALDTGSVVSVYQPVVSLQDGSIRAVEALARWTHPVHGAVSPEVFVGLAERNGLVDALTRLMVERACADIRWWHDELGDLCPRQVHVNVSPLQLPGDFVPQLMSEMLERYAVPPEAVCLEITEGALMVNPDAALATLTRLHDMGVGLAIDDFGTGQSSLAYLCRLPVDCLKIDRSFVADLPDPRPRSVADAVVSLAESLGLNTIAEGVETAEQAACLAALGCPAAQGWRYARPMAASALPAWVAAHLPVTQHDEAGPA